MGLYQKNILIVGLGVSGMSAARFAKNKGGIVTVTDMAKEDALAAYLPEIREMGIKTELGRHPVEVFEKSDLIILSPGVPHTIAPINRAREKGVPILGELELACRYIREPIVAVSGTNGKTTTTQLLGRMLENSGFEVFVGGNIGNPLIDYAQGEKRADIVVVEVSSFQLDTIETFRPRISVLLNISEDHLDRYANFDAYIRSKGRIFENQTETDTAVINGADPHILSVSRTIRARVLPFYEQGHVDGKYKEYALIKRRNGQHTPGIEIFTKENPEGFLDLSKVNLLGRHNMENAAAAALATLAAGGRIESVQAVLNDFKGLSHRLEFVKIYNGVHFYDDSKGTNIDAVAKALDVFDAPVILIMGGRDKGGDYKRLREPVIRHAKKLIVMGESAQAIKSALEDICPGGAQVASGMEDAVHSAYRSAASGDIVLLSPGCSSFDMYENYAQRGNAFCRAVENFTREKRDGSSGAKTVLRRKTKSSKQDTGYGRG
ncbi:MAG: UDP-N-acetylmuramoyl-L-alanine--D-glutamate ligase [Desulfobacterales bacterium]|nr:UDP-N-acetylmuramoyl-L-alanine--D-glutamate ligase [Desulfobacterales bacterium]